MIFENNIVIKNAYRYSIFHLVELLNNCNNAKHDSDYDKSHKERLSRSGVGNGEETYWRRYKTHFRNKRMR